MVKVLREDAGTDQLHACGGKARCTTCRVEFVAGEPGQDDDRREDDSRGTRSPSGVRLSCQIPLRARYDRADRQPPEGSGRKLIVAPRFPMNSAQTQ
ncbi:MAG: 2Fe-2S iron-sulfur cluster-binding protein [Pirellulaceae bacterium]